MTEQSPHHSESDTSHTASAEPEEGAVRTDEEGPPAPRGEEEPEGHQATDTRSAEHPGALSAVTSAEALSLAGVVFSVMALVGSRLVEVLSSVTAADQLGAVANTIVGDGAFALLGLVLGLIALGRFDVGSRPWARWLASAAVLIGGIGVLLAVLSYPMLPDPQPQAPPMPAPQ